MRMAVRVSVRMARRMSVTMPRVPAVSMPVRVSAQMRGSQRRHCRQPGETQINGQTINVHRKRGFCVSLGIF